jgi:hypothetical protein
MSDGRRFYREASDLLNEVAHLRMSVAADGKATFKRWRPRLERRPFAMSALNLAHYLALRGRDLRPLQRRLMGLGLSSLGRAEIRVLATLDSVTVALAEQAGVPSPVRMPSYRQFFRGEERLKKNTDILFGRHRKGGSAASSSPSPPKRRSSRTSSCASPSTAPMRCASSARMTMRRIGAR